MIMEIVLMSVYNFFLSTREPSWKWDSITYQSEWMQY